MRFFIPKKTLVWVILLLSAIIFAIFLSGCFGAGVRPPGDSKTPPTVGSALTRVAIVATTLAAGAFILCGIGAWFAPIFRRKLLQGMLAALGVIVCAQFLFWFAANLGLVTIILILLALGCGVFWAWRHIGKVERFLGLDLNNDGQIGTVKQPAIR